MNKVMLIVIAMMFSVSGFGESQDYTYQCELKWQRIYDMERKDVAVETFTIKKQLDLGHQFKKEINGSVFFLDVGLIDGARYSVGGPWLRVLYLIFHEHTSDDEITSFSGILQESKEKLHIVALNTHKSKGGKQCEEVITVICKVDY